MEPWRPCRPPHSATPVRRARRQSVTIMALPTCARIQKIIITPTAQQHYNNAYMIVGWGSVPPTRKNSTDLAVDNLQGTSSSSCLSTPSEHWRIEMHLISLPKTACSRRKGPNLNHTNALASAEKCFQLLLITTDLLRLRNILRSHHCHH